MELLSDEAIAALRSLYLSAKELATVSPGFHIFLHGKNQRVEDLERNLRLRIPVSRYLWAKIPPEIFDQIIQNLDHRDLAAVCCVCHQLGELASRHLYQRVFVAAGGRDEQIFASDVFSDRIPSFPMLGQVPSRFRREKSLFRQLLVYIDPEIVSHNETDLPYPLLPGDLANIRNVHIRTTYSPNSDENSGFIKWWEKTLVHLREIHTLELYRCFPPSQIDSPQLSTGESETHTATLPSSSALKNIRTLRIAFRDAPSSIRDVAIPLIESTNDRLRVLELYLPSTAFPKNDLLRTISFKTHLRKLNLLFACAGLTELSYLWTAYIFPQGRVHVDLDTMDLPPTSLQSLEAFSGNHMDALTILRRGSLSTKGPYLRFLSVLDESWTPWGPFNGSASEWCQALKSHRIQDLSISKAQFTDIIRHNHSGLCFVKNLCIQLEFSASANDVIDLFRTLPYLPSLSWFYLESNGGQLMKWFSFGDFGGQAMDHTSKNHTLKLPVDEHELEFFQSVTSSIPWKNLPSLTHLILSESTDDHIIVVREMDRTVESRESFVRLTDWTDEHERLTGISKKLAHEGFERLRARFHRPQPGREWYTPFV